MKNRFLKQILLFLLVFCLTVPSGLISFPVETEAASSSFLFIGNSLTYYNNMPEMFQSMMAAGGYGRPAIYTAVHGGKKLSQHANAIAAVIRTKGDISQLKSSEKQWFETSTDQDLGTGETNYSPEMYSAYAAVIWDYKRQRPKRYDYIVLQPYYANGTGDSSTESVRSSIGKIITSMNSSSTSYLVNSIWNRWTGSLSSFTENQMKIDSIVGNAVDKVLNDSSLNKKCLNILPVYSGRAFCNYLYYSGTDIASEREPSAYTVYSARGTRRGVINDLLYGDSFHCTQLGSFLVAACLYAAAFGRSFQTARSYTGGTTFHLENLVGSSCPNYGIFYNQGAGFTDSIITRQTAFIADQTIRGNMYFTSSSQARRWKENPSCTNFDYMNYKVKITFRASRALTNTYGSQTFYYGQKGNRFSGTISRNGYQCLGWALTKNASKARYRLSYVVKDSWIKRIYENPDRKGKLTLYAVWKAAPSVKVVFKGNGADSSTFEKQVFTLGQEDQKFTGTISRKGFNFLGWALSPTAKSARYQPNHTVSDKWIKKISSSSKYKGKITLYAVWEEIPSLHVVFNGNGATKNTFSEQTFVYGVSGQQFKGKIARTGSEFLGWSLFPMKMPGVQLFDCNMKVTNKFIKTYFEDPSYSGTITLYAVWDTGDSLYLMDVEEESSEEPTSEEPATEEPVTGEIPSEEPLTEEIPSEEPIPEEPSSVEIPSEEPIPEEPSSVEIPSEEPGTEEPSSVEIPSEEPITEEPSFVEIPSEEPVSEEPSLVEIPSEEPITEEPSSEEILSGEILSEVPEEESK